MQISSESELQAFANDFAQQLELPTVVELVGDVGVGKTTFTRYLAAALGIKTPVTSPSFTISKRYAFTKNHQPCTLIHYDFYRLSDPGLMADDLAENLTAPHTLVVVEWADSVANLLPPNRHRLHFTLQPDGSRLITIKK